jgi:hypothetical protein
LPPTASETEIAVAVKRLLTEPHFRIASRRLGIAIKADIEACSLVHELETVATRRKAKLIVHRSQLRASA